MTTETPLRPAAGADGSYETHDSTIAGVYPADGAPTDREAELETGKRCDPFRPDY